MATAQSDSAQQFLRRAIELQQAGRNAEAIADYQAFLKTHPEAAPVRSNLGAALAQEGRYSEAVQQYTLALQADPSNYGIRLNRGLSYYKTGDIAHAVPDFEAAYKAQPVNGPNRRQLALLLGECYLRRGENERVVALLDPIASSDANDLALDYLLGTALVHEGHTDRGALLIQKLLQNGDTAEAHMLMAYTRYQARDKKSAIQEVDRAIALNPKLPEAYVLRGRLAYLDSDLKGAEAAFRQAVVLAPLDFDARLWLGTLLLEEGQLPEAHANLERALELRPDDIRARYQFASLCSSEGDDKRAAALLEALIRDSPDYLEAHRTLAMIYFRLGQRAAGRRERKVAEQLAAVIQAKDLERGRTLK